jgi:hypothetical protein
MHQVTNKTRDTLIFSVVIFILTIAIIVVISHVSSVAAMVILLFLAGLQLGDFIYILSQKLVDWLDETW